jgi:thiopeptide-type bacteriocin biosynthesis protein
VTQPSRFTADYFVLRTPLLPFDELASWPGARIDVASLPDAELDQAVAAQRVRLRERLCILIEDPVVREALNIASLDFLERLDDWSADASGKKGDRVELALARYVMRMTARPTPFGLFAGVSFGRFGAISDLKLTPRASYRRVTRIDSEYLFRIAGALTGEPRHRAGLRCLPNNSLALIGGTYRYLSSSRVNRALTYDLYTAEPTDYLDAALNLARSKPRVRDVCAMLSGTYAVTPEEAQEYVNELLDSQILVFECAPGVTSEDPLDPILAAVAEVPEASTIRDTLEDAVRMMRELDARPLGVEASGYQAIRARLQPLGVADPDHQFQTDMFKPLAASQLNRDVADELFAAVEFLRSQHTGRSRAQVVLEKFAERFVKRYESQRIPLLEALDAGLGIGFDDPEITASAEPLVKGLFPAGRAETREQTWSTRLDTVLQILTEATRDGLTEVDLAGRWEEALRQDERPPLPDSFSAFATLVASSPEALRNGNFRVSLISVNGPSGANLVGRFCHGDDQMKSATRELLAHEASLDPVAIFAEIVHIPPNERSGNFICRPTLREYEIPYLAHSAVAPEKQILVSDLLVSVDGGVVQIHSRLDGRRVYPRMANAHAFHNLFNLPVYRLLCCLQDSGVSSGLGWDWGPLRSASFLPRLTYHRTIISPATWNLPQSGLPEFSSRGAKRRRSVHAWRTKWNVPRFIVTSELCIDLENELALDTMGKLVEKRQAVTFQELSDGGESLCIEGPEGRFTNEIVVPFRRVVPLPGRRNPPMPAAEAKPFILGSDWLYAEIYCGISTGDDVLRRAIDPFIVQLAKTNDIKRWFFIRYSDPDLHLRVRLQADPGVLTGNVIPALHAALQPFIESGAVWRVRFEGYQRESERYGGDEGVVLAEELFAIDSEAVLTMLREVEDEDLAETRWRFALMGVDRMAGDFGFSRAERSDLFKRLATAMKTVLGAAGALLSKRINDRFRSEMPSLTALMEGHFAKTNRALQTAGDILRKRSERMRPLAERIREGIATGSIAKPAGELLASYIHMHVNRALRAAHRQQEVVIYDLAARTNAALVAQGKS